MRQVWEFMRLATLENPVMLKELRIGLREKRIFFVQLGFLAFLLATVLMWLPGMDTHEPADRLPEQGRNLFMALIVTQALLLAMVAPGLTCGSISGERERHSLDMVMASRLSSAEIVAGKLGFAIYYLLLLLFSSLPLASVAFFLGGLGPMEAAAYYLELLMMAVFGAEIGLFFSARETRSNYATTQSYLATFLFMLSWVFYIAVRSLDWIDVNGIWLHPLMAVLLCQLYLSVFLFLKAMHRLRPRAGTLKLMAWCFLFTYTCEMIFGLAALHDLYQQADLDPDLGIGYSFFSLGHLILAGIFLNETSLDSQAEEGRFRKSWFSRELFWLFFLAVGLVSPAIVDVAVGGLRGGHDALYASCSLAVIQLFCLPVLVRGVQTLLPGKLRFAGIYFMTVAVLIVLPSLGLLGDLPKGLSSGIYLSPLFSIQGIWDAGVTGTVGVFGASEPIGTVSAIAYCSLAGFFAVLHLLKRRRVNPS